jgi:hypothetical protein
MVTVHIKQAPAGVPCPCICFLAAAAAAASAAALLLCVAGGLCVCLRPSMSTCHQQLLLYHMLPACLPVTCSYSRVI